MDFLHNLIQAGCHEHRSTCGTVLRSHCRKLFTFSNGSGMTVQRNNVWYSTCGIRSNLRAQHCVTVKIRPIRLTHEATLWSVSQFITEQLALLPHRTSQPWPGLSWLQLNFVSESEAKITRNFSTRNMWKLPICHCESCQVHYRNSRAWSCRADYAQITQHTVQ